MRRGGEDCVGCVLVLGMPFDVEFPTCLGFKAERLSPGCEDQQFQSVRMNMQLSCRVAGDFKLDQGVLRYLKDKGVSGLEVTQNSQL